jgi:hypothetical protein
MEKTHVESQACRSCLSLTAKIPHAADLVHLAQVREEVPVPEVPSNGFLVKVLAAGGRSPAPD